MEVRRVLISRSGGRLRRGGHPFCGQQTRALHTEVSEDVAAFHPFNDCIYSWSYLEAQSSLLDVKHYPGWKQVSANEHLVRYHCLWVSVTQLQAPVP